MTRKVDMRSNIAIEYSLHASAFAENHRCIDLGNRTGDEPFLRLLWSGRRASHRAGGRSGSGVDSLPFASPGNGSTEVGLQSADRRPRTDLPTLPTVDRRRRSRRSVRGTADILPVELGIPPAVLVRDPARLAGAAARHLRRSAAAFVWLDSFELALRARHLITRLTTRSPNDIREGRALRVSA